MNLEVAVSKSCTFINHLDLISFITLLLDGPYTVAEKLILKSLFLLYEWLAKPKASVQCNLHRIYCSNENDKMCTKFP